MPNMSGKTLGKVQIGDLIARGGMAEVYVGEHTALNRKVAVKIMRELAVDSDPDSAQRFEREARAAAALRHPNIIQVFDFDLTEGQPFLIMEYVPGVSLGAYLRALQRRGERLPFSAIARLMNALAAAIDYAHAQGLIHRDIKPANVLLRSASGPIDPEKQLPADVEPILTDFGLVRLLDSSIQTSAGSVSGTPAYMSPEQAHGEKVDLKTDIYSLGVMLYEMLSGRVPFEAESTFGILMKHMNEPPPAVDGISSDLQAVLDRALAKDPALRYDSATQLASEFSAVFNGQTVSLNTLKFATLARQNAAKGAPAQRLFSMSNVAVAAVFILIGLAFVAIRNFAPASAALAPIGSVSFADASARMDQVTVTLTDLARPENGTHYEVWLLAQGGETRAKIGVIKMSGDRHGDLIYKEPKLGNLVGMFDQIEVTIEPDNDPNPDESSGDIVASSVYPPLALLHIRHVDSAFGGAPNQRALIEGMLADAESIDNSMQDLQTAFKNNDEASVRARIEEVINQIVGKSDTAEYKDWDGNGVVADPSDGYGLLQPPPSAGADSYSGSGGYIPGVISHANYAADAIDATAAIQANRAAVVTSAENVQGWSKQLLEKALDLESTPFGPQMSPAITQMAALSKQMLDGTDSNNNQKIEPIIGEGGAETAYTYAYEMAVMPLLPGAHQVPVAAKPAQ